MQKIKFPTVHYFYRSPKCKRFSIERLFESVREALSSHMVIKEIYAPFASANPILVLLNCLHGWWNRGRINHVTGATHYLAILLRKRNTVLTIHDFVGIDNRNGIRKWLISLIWFRIPICRAGKITVISYETRRKLLEHFPNTDPAKIQVIPNCYSREFVFSEPKIQADRRIRLLQIGCGWNKNLERVALACAGLKCVLRIVGNPNSDQAELLDRGGVEWTSVSGISDAEIVKEYRNCDAVIFVSLYEGFGLPILEAQATGRPVITSDRAPMNEIVNAGCAILVDPESVESIRSGIERLQNSRELMLTLVNAGVENVKEFSVDKVAAQYLAVYRELDSLNP